MAQATLQRVLDDIGTLEMEELRQVEGAIQEQRESSHSGYSLAEWRVMQTLLQQGLLKEIRPCNRTPKKDRRLIFVEGKPISETIIEERR